MSVHLAPLRPTLVALTLLLALSPALAHKPFFPEGDGPFALRNPTVSQAHYLRIGGGVRHVFVVPPLPRAVPVEVLVLDDALGRSLELTARWRCGGIEESLSEVDQPFFESFSRLEHRYRVVDRIGPTDEACEVIVFERRGATGPYTFALGDEERFSVGDVVGLVGLGGKLRAWQEGAP